MTGLRTRCRCWFGLAAVVWIGLSGRIRAEDLGTIAPASLVRQLGADRYAEREAASKLLEALGPQALPALKSGRLSDDAEIRRRAAELATRIEITWMIDVREVLDWLPEDTETLIVARGPFPTETERPPDVIPIVQFYQLQACGMAFDQRIWPQVAEALPELPVRLAVEGSRRFRGRIGPLPERYEGCHLMLYHSDVAPGGPDLDPALAAAASRVENVAGYPIAVFEPRPQFRRRFRQEFEPTLGRSLFVAWVRPDALAVATDRGFLVEVLRRAGTPPKEGGGEPVAQGPPRVFLDQGVEVGVDADEEARNNGATAGRRLRALPEDLPEWAHVVTTAPAWALRHYVDDLEDGTAPRNWPAGGRPYNRDPGAIGLVAWVDPEGTAIEVRYLSDHPGARDVVRPFWTARLAEAELSQQDTETVAIRLPAEDARGVVFSWFTLVTALGHPPVERW